MYYLLLVPYYFTYGLFLVKNYLSNKRFMVCEKEFNGNRQHGKWSFSAALFRKKYWCLLFVFSDLFRLGITNMNREVR